MALGLLRGNSSLTVLLCIEININGFQEVVMLVVKEQDPSKWEASSLRSDESTNHLKFGVIFTGSF